MAKPWSHERTLKLALAGLLLALGGLSLDRAARGRFDFHHFYLDARYVWEHGALNPDVGLPPTEYERQLPFYLPVVPLLLSPIAACGRLPAAILWTAGQMAALAYSFSVLRRWVGSDRRASVSFGLAALLAVPAFVEAARFNQLSYFVLALVLGGTTALERGQPWRAGAIFAGAAGLKLLPAIFLPWLLLKRRWSAAAAFVATAMLAAVLPPLIAFGPQRAWEYHRQWWEYNVRGDAAGGLLNASLPEHFINHRNQSLAQVIARLTWRDHPYAAPHRLAELDPQTGKRLADGIALLLFAALLWTTRKSWVRLSAEQRRGEAAAYALGMLVLSPLVRQYYLVWALPALVLLAQAAVAADAPRVRRLGRWALVLWTLGMLAWMWPMARLYGAHLLMLIVLGTLLLASCGSRRTADGLSTSARAPRHVD